MERVYQAASGYSPHSKFEKKGTELSIKKYKKIRIPGKVAFGASSRQEFALQELVHIEWLRDQMIKNGPNFYGGKRMYDAEMKKLFHEYERYYKIAFGE